MVRPSYSPIPDRIRPIAGAVAGSSMLIELITTSSAGRSNRSVLVRVDGVDDVTGRLVGHLAEDGVLAVQVRRRARP